MAKGVPPRIQEPNNIYFYGIQIFEGIDYINEEGGIRLISDKAKQARWKKNIVIKTTLAQPSEQSVEKQISESLETSR